MRVLMERLMEGTEKKLSEEGECLGREKDLWIRYLQLKW